LEEGDKRWAASTRIGTKKDSHVGGPTYAPGPSRWKRMKGRRSIASNTKISVEGGGLRARALLGLMKGGEGGGKDSA